MAAKKTKAIWEFGDFQTPNDLAMEIATVLQKMKIAPASIIEPTCGIGNLLISAIKAYPNIEQVIGVDTNFQYLTQLRSRVVLEDLNPDIEIIHANFFDIDWETQIAKLPQPILVVGNPPWVTNSELSTLQSQNLPEKSNIYGHNGLDAVTGKSNFDISEWMLLQQINWLQSRYGVLAMLCKNTVARKILVYSWKNKLKVTSAQIFKIDAKHHFDAAVDACLLVMTFDQKAVDWHCNVFANLAASQTESTLGYQDGFILANLGTYQNLRHLYGVEEYYTWRSGIKHDCSKIMELVQENNRHFTNGEGQHITLEDGFIYPMLKSSDIGNGRAEGRGKYMIVTQTSVGEDTSKIKKLAPQTWSYLQQHRSAFAKRGSSIYKNRPDYSIFGVGEYTFAPWKVAISGFYKKLNFIPVGPIEEKPVVFDDTVYFLSCHSREEAEFLAGLLNSQLATQFLNSMIFWEDKRPITIEVLKRLNIHSLARVLGHENLYLSFVAQSRPEATQLRLLEKSVSYSVFLQKNAVPTGTNPKSQEDSL